MNLDQNHAFPSQLIDGDPTECCALTIADICGNADGRLYDPDIVYAYTQRLMGVVPNTSGLDPYTAMLMPIVYGMLPMTFDAFDAKTMGELYIANYQNYTAQQRSEALKYVCNGVKRLFTYDDITAYLAKYQQGASLAIHWFPQFNTPNADGTLPNPVGAPISIHNVAVYEDTPLGLRFKPWLGPGYGAGGYGFISRAQLAQCMVFSGGYDPNAWRWLSLAQIGFDAPWQVILSDILPQMTVAAKQRP